MKTRNVLIYAVAFTIICSNSVLPVISATKSTQINAQSIQLGNKYAQIAHDAYKKGQYLKTAQNYEKAYQANKVKVYLDNAVTAYTGYASELANDKDYNNAIVYCNKALSLNPKDNNTKELLADIYYARGSDYFYTGQLDKAKVELENSLKASINKDQKERAQDGILKIAESLKAGAIPVPKYEQSTDNAIPATLSILENKIYGASNDSAPLLSRLGKIEKDILGQTYEADSLIVRIDRLKRSLLPESIQQQTNSQLGSNQVYDDTYLKDIIEQSAGKISIFGKIPITVYIKDANVKPYKGYYRDAVIEGLKEWEKASDNIIKFEVINEPARSDIQIVWQEEFEDFPWQPTLQKEDISAEKQRMKYRKANAAVQMGSIAAMLAGSFVPVIGGVGAIANSFASPLLQYKGTKIDKLSPDVKINTKITQNMSKEDAKIKIKQITIHQVGHALGIYGHSSDPNDIMYSNFTAMRLSERDINTIREIYKSKEKPKQ